MYEKLINRLLPGQFFSENLMWLANVTKFPVQTGL